MSIIKFIKFVVFTFIFIFSAEMLHAQWIEFCKDDICISSTNAGCKFQVVQAVWVDDIDDNDLLLIGGSPLLCECDDDLKMIKGKPSLIFGTRQFSGDVRDPIRLQIRNYYIVAKDIRVKFTIVEEGNRQIALSGIYTLPAAVPSQPCNYYSLTTVDITAPLPTGGPGDYFAFQGSGERNIRMEIVDAAGNPLAEPNSNNHSELLKCQVINSMNIYVDVQPSLFWDQVYADNQFFASEPWFLGIRDNINYMYEIFPVPFHNVNDKVSCIDYRDFIGGKGIDIPSLQDWMAFSPNERENKWRDFFGRWGRMTKWKWNFYKRFMMVDNHTTNGFLARDNYLGLTLPGITRHVAIIDWGPGNHEMVYAHEVGHTFALNHLRTDAHGYRVLTRQYRNNNIHFMHDTFHVAQNYWMRKSVYKILANNFYSGDNLRINPIAVNVSFRVTRINNNVTLLPFYKFTSGNIYFDTVSTGRYQIILKNENNQTLKQYYVNMGFELIPSYGDGYEGDSIIQVDTAIASFNIPDTTGVKTIEVRDSLSNLLASRSISNNPPTIDVTHPNPGQTFGNDSIFIGWNSSDPDGDTLYHFLFWSNDGGLYYDPVDFDIQGNHYNWRSIFAPGSNNKVKVYVTDGYHTSVDSSSTFIIGINQISQNVPNGYKLFQNYPNPFNPTTKIRFELPKLSYTKIIVYDILGREMEDLVNLKLKPGTYEVEWDGTYYPSGVYFYKLVVDEFVDVKKMILVK
ncbi:MAG: T9SS type A sorting domain-containing protein [Ignavibacteria bacterium]|nr:T9SS type A sorting domain-containing protein [Ignavibacteria bacterium]